MFGRRAELVKSVECEDAVPIFPIPHAMFKVLGGTGL